MDTTTYTIYLVSGGIGASGEHLINTVLAQFPGDIVKMTTVGNIRHRQQVDTVLSQAQANGGLVVHTLVDLPLRDYLIEEAQRLNVQTVDLFGPILSWVIERAATPPLGQPGLYRALHREYFDRVAAIDYTLTHDDGKNPEGWAQAEAVLVGVSRVGKTPLSVYLAVLGWKVANYPLVPQIPIPKQLFKLDPRRVIGLTIEPGQLIQYRQQRQQRLGVTTTSAYMDPKAVYEEVSEAIKIFRRGGFTIVNMTDKTIELGADEIIRRVFQRLNPEADRSDTV